MKTSWCLQLKQIVSIAYFELGVRREVSSWVHNVSKQCFTEDKGSRVEGVEVGRAVL